MATLCGEFMARCKDILDKEGVQYVEGTLAQIILKHAPDWRRILNELQRQSSTGSITSSESSSTQYDSLFEHLKSKDFKKMRSWVVNNIDTDASSIFRGIYDKMTDKVAPNSIPQLVLILADYQYKNAFAADHELNIVACMTEIMANVEFV